MIQIKRFTTTGLLNAFLEDQKIIYKDLIVKKRKDRTDFQYILVYESLQNTI